MAALDRFQSTYRCKQCGAEAVAEVTENDYPFMSSADRRVDIAAPFYVKHQRNSNDVVWCSICNIEVR